MRAKILNASAGSGKTYTLAYHYLREVIREPMLYRHTLAVTFTNKATEEMKSRILKEVHLLASGHESSYMDSLRRDLSLSEEVIRRRSERVQHLILHDYSHFTVLTIDKFFQRILHAFVKELGIDLGYNVELEAAPILQRSVDALIERIREDERLRGWLEAYATERIDESEGWDLRNDILKLGHELFKEGNRKALDAAASKEELDRIIGRATQSTKASKGHFFQLGKEAVERIAQMGLTLEEFSYKNSSGAAYFYTVASGNIEPPKTRVRQCAASTSGWMTKSQSSRYEAEISELQGRMAALCDYYDQHYEEWNSLDLIREHYRSFGLLSDLYERVQEIWREENSLLLSETKNILAAFIDRNDAPFIYEKVGNRYDRYLIDEFQDTSEREWLNFLPLLREAISHAAPYSSSEEAETAGPAVLLVGDVKQSIYRWRGGDWRILGHKAEEALPQVEVENMIYNFRSFRKIVEFNNEAMAHVVTAVQGHLQERLAEGQISDSLRGELLEALPMAYREHRQRPRKRSKKEGYISIQSYEKQPPVVERVCELLERGYRPCDLLILVRSATDGGRVARMLLDFKRENNNPLHRFDVMTQDALEIASSPICGFLIALMYLVVDPEDSIRRGVYNRYLGYKIDRPLEEDERLFLGRLSLLPIEEAFEQIVLKYRLDQRTEQIAYLQAFHEELTSYLKGRVADLPLFLAWWEEQGSKRSLSVERSLDTIEITTIHKAKGLERRVVIIPYCNWKLEPKTSGQTPNLVWAEAEGALSAVGALPVKYGSAMADSHFSSSYYRELAYSYVDNVNLLYVALTRAIEELHIFIPTARSEIGAHLWSAIQRTEEGARLGEIRGGYSSGEGFERYTFGEELPPEEEERPKEERRVEHLTLREYPTIDPRPALRLPTTSFREHGGEVELSPRNFGVLMHRLFEEARDHKELKQRVEHLKAQGVVDQEQAEELSRRLEQALSDPLVMSWYEGAWEHVLSERDLLLPATEKGHRRRPDRVMLRGQEAVVVDYKFGEKDPHSYHRQVADYMRYLRSMGYTKVEGWIWYVLQGRTERVTLLEKEMIQ